jgi:hypothetical protein
LLVLLGTFGLLVVAAIGSLALQFGVPDGPPLSARGYGVTGSVALARWAEALGYKTRIVEGRPYQLPDDMRLLLMLQPDARYALNDSEQQELLRWVHAGGTLVLAEESDVSYPETRHGPAQASNGDTSALQAFGFGVDSTGLVESGGDARVVMAKAFGDEPAGGSFSVRSADVLTVPVDARTLATVDGRPVIASRQVGNGLVIASSTTFPFTNDGLRDNADARVVLSLLHLAPAGGVVGFDEYHHGSRQTASILSWMVSAPSGLALTLALALVAVYVVWTGRRMGRAFVPPELRIRRQPSEYVTAMANLARAAGQSDYTLRRYRDTLKQRLGRPYRIDPALDDDAFVDELLKAGAPVDAARLRALLNALRRGTRSKAELVRLAREAGEFGT